MTSKDLLTPRVALFILAAVAVIAASVALA